MKSAKGIWLAVIVGAVCALSVFVFAPRFYLWNIHGIYPFYLFPESSRAPDLLMQLYHPFFKPLNPANNVNQWRILLPMMANLIRLPWHFYFSLPFLFSYAMVALCAVWVYRRTESLRAATIAAALSATSSFFFVSTGFLGYMDAALGIAILAAVIAESPLSLFALGMFIPWMDERFILALPIILYCRWVLDKPWRPCLWMGVGILPYLGARMIAALNGWGFSSDYIGSVLKFNHHLPRLAEGILASLRWAWIAAAGAFIWASPSKRNWGLAGVSASLLVCLLIAGDYSRTLGVAFILSIVSIVLAWPHKKVRIWLGVLALANFITPAYHCFRQFILPIKPLYKQIQLYQNLKDYQSPHDERRTHYHTPGVRGN